MHARAVTGEGTALRNASVFAALLLGSLFMNRHATADELETTENAAPEPDDELAAIFRYPKILRIHGGVGFAQRAKTDDGLSLSAVGGVQLMLPANATQSFGVEVDYLQTDARNQRRYIATILFVENRMFGWFLMSIGLGAYVPLEGRRPTPVGISTKLGWAPNYHKVVNPFVLLRADWVFHDRIVGSLKVDTGIAFSF